MIEVLDRAASPATRIWTSGGCSLARLSVHPHQLHEAIPVARDLAHDFDGTNFSPWPPNEQVLILALPPEGQPALRGDIIPVNLIDRPVLHGHEP